MNRINLICLGVRNMQRALQFYRDGLGFQTKEAGDNPHVVFFQNNGTRLELYPLDLLAKDIDADSPPTGHGFAGITLSYNTKTREEVDEVILRAQNAGAKIVKTPQNAFWGGYHAYFRDPDGYYWEVANGSIFSFDENDMLIT